MSDDKRLDAGGFYGLTPDGRAIRLPAQRPDMVVCRRVTDVPQALLSRPNAAFDQCPTCREMIVFNNDELFPDVPKSCMQCQGIQPDPL